MHLRRAPLRGRGFSRSALVFALTLAALAWRPPDAAAQTVFRWDDEGSAVNRNWDTAANWFNVTQGINNVTPTPTGADVQFGIGYTTPIVINLNGDRSVNSLAFGVPASTTLSGNTLTVSSGVVTAYGTQFNGTGSALPPTGSAVTAPAIVNSNLALSTAGLIDVQGSAELQTNGAITAAFGAGITRSGSGLWSIGGTANTFSGLALQANTVSGVATTRFGDVGTAAGGSLGINASGAANQIVWGVSNRLLFTGSAANQTLAKNIALSFNGTQQAIYSFETFNAMGAVGPNVGSLTLAGTISGDLTNGGTAVSNSFNFNVASPTDPNFAVVLSGANTFRATTTIQGGTVKLTNDAALGSNLTVVQFGSGATGAGARTDAALLVNAGRTIAQKITTFGGSSGDTSVYTLGGAGDFTSGTSTFTGAIDLGTGTSARGLTLAANGTSVVVLSGAATGALGTGTAQANKLVKVGTGTVRMTASSSFTGAVEVRAGTLQLQGSGAWTGTSGTVTVLTGGTLELNNTSGAVANRVSTSRGVDLGGGTLSLVGGTTSLGVVTVRPGAASVVVDPNGGSSTISVLSLARPGVGTGMGGTVDFRAVNGGVLGSTAKVTVTTAPTLANGILGGWATVNGADWATYGASPGVTAFTGYVPFASATATDNAVVGDGATTSAVAAVNSLKLDLSAPGGSLNTGGTLTLGTGGVLQTGGQPYTIANAIAATTDLAATVDGTLTLAGPVTAGGLSKAGPGTLVLGANVTLTGTPALNVNAGTLTFQGDNRLLGTAAVVNLNSPAAVGIDLAGTTQTLGGLSGVGSVAVGSGTLTIRNPDTGGTDVLGGPVSGSGSLIKAGLRTQRLTADNPFTGSITVNRGSLVLMGANAATGPVTLRQFGYGAAAVNANLLLSGGGTLAAASTQPIAIGPGGSLSMANDDTPTVAASVRTDRVADGRPITLSGGTISFTGATQSFVAASETLGPLTVQPGASTIRSMLHPDTIAPGGPATLTFTSLTRQSGSTVDFAPTTSTAGTVGAAGGGSPRVFVTSGLAAGVLPWATVTTRPSATTFDTFFAAYNTTGAVANSNGIQVLDPAAQVAFASAGPADHALLSNGATLAGPQTVSTLTVRTTTTGQSLDLGANNLVLGSGGLLRVGSQDYAVTGTGTLGQAGTELVIHTFNTASTGTPVLTVGTPIAANGLVKAGGAALSLTANNTYAGPTTVGAGWLQVLNPITSATDSATSSGAVTTFPGTFLLGGNATGTAGQITGPVTVGGTLIPGTLTGGGAAGILTVRNTVTFNPDQPATFTVLLGGNTPGSQYSQLKVIGDVALNGAILSPQFSGTPSGQLTIIDVTGGTVSGRFIKSDGTVLNDGDVFATFGGVPWFISYTPTSVVVAPVPEPAGVLALAAAGLAGARRLRRRSAGRA